MKKIILAGILLSVVFLPVAALAADNIKQAGDNLIKVAGDKGAGLSDDLPGTAATVVKAVLALVGTVFFGLSIYAGLRWMTAQGNEEKVTKAKDTLEAAIIGIVIVFLAYAITAFVTGRLGSPAPTAPGGQAGGIAAPAQDDSARCKSQAGELVGLTTGSDTCDSQDYFSGTILFTTSDNSQVCCQYDDESTKGCTARGGFCTSDLICATGTEDIGDCPSESITTIDDQCCRDL